MLVVLTPIQVMFALRLPVTAARFALRLPVTQNTRRSYGIIEDCEESMFALHVCVTGCHLHVDSFS